MKTLVVMNSMPPHLRPIFDLLNGSFPYSPFTSSHTLLVAGEALDLQKEQVKGDVLAMVPDAIINNKNTIHSAHSTELKGYVEKADRYVMIFHEVYADYKREVIMVDKTKGEEQQHSILMNLRPPSEARDMLVDFLAAGVVPRNR